MPAPLSLDAAVDLTRTGDVWLFRGRTVADRAIRLGTNAPVNHVGMSVVLEDLPPLLWHAELGRSLVDVWSGTHQRGVQLHDLREAVLTWGTRYGQRAWLRQLEATVTAAMEDAVLRTVARLDGTPFPSTSRLATRWLLSRRKPDGRRGLLSGRSRPERGEMEAGGPGPAHRPELETAFCAEVVALTYEAMGLLPADRHPGWYDPGRFWSGDDLALAGGARLGGEIAVDIAAG